jgi:lysine biosynthesis protein LysW
MFRCNECGSILDLIKPEQGTMVECDLCGIELEVDGNTLLSLHLGPSEE